VGLSVCDWNIDSEECGHVAAFDSAPSEINMCQSRCRIRIIKNNGLCLWRV
jgi:hypothetical protein